MAEATAVDWIVTGTGSAGFEWDQMAGGTRPSSEEREAPIRRGIIELFERLEDVMHRARLPTEGLAAPSTVNFAIGIRRASKFVEWPINLPRALDNYLTGLREMPQVREIAAWKSGKRLHTVWRVDTFSNEWSTPGSTLTLPELGEFQKTASPWLVWGDAPLIDIDQIDATTALHLDANKKVDAIRHQLEEFSSLEEGWDGHGAKSLSQIACDSALTFLELLGSKAALFEPYPEPDGSVGLEYHDADRGSIHLSFSPTGDLAYVAARGTEVHGGRGVRMEKEIPPALKPFLDGII